MMRHIDMLAQVSSFAHRRCPAGEFSAMLPGSTRNTAIGAFETQHCGAGAGWGGGQGSRIKHEAKKVARGSGPGALWTGLL